MNENDIFKYEEEHLNDTVKKIKEELVKSKNEMIKLSEQNKKLSYDDKKRGEHFNLISIMDLVDKKIGILNRALSVPYFGRIDFSSQNDEENKLYIGKSGISSNGKNIVTDWRAPISSLYYDSEVGEVEYNAPEGLIKGNMNLKRQLYIKDSKLLDVQDSSLVTNDELLRPYLSVNADNKMKIIISSIQKEQNNIIRKSPYQNIIVQGVAGSGKTSVALHRIAYLIYELGDRVTSEQFLILGPNEYFLKYVSSILPDLETSPVNEKTFINYAREYLEEKINIKNDDKIDDSKKSELLKRIQAFKSSLEYKNLIDDFMGKYVKENMVKDDFKIYDDVIFQKELIREYLFSMGDYPNYNRLENFMLYTLKENSQKIYDKVNKKYRDIYISLPLEDPYRKELVEYSNKLYVGLVKDYSKIVKRYIKDIKMASSKIYIEFLENLSNYDLPFSIDEIKVFKEETVSDLNKKKISFSDFPALIYITYRLTNKTNNYKYIIIDEAQDYGMFHFDVLKRINPNSIFSIYGDLAQSIYSYRSIDSWKNVNKDIFDNSCELLKLNKSYRTTIEITNNANQILEYLNLNLAEPVIRNGADVSFNNVSKENGIKLKIIDDMKRKGYETIAIICKTEKEAINVNKYLNDNGINSKYLSNNDSEYDGDIFVLTSASSKGLEFDGVIINDASSKSYNTCSAVDMHLLYVASTRALHELVIMYDRELVSVYNQDNNKKKLKELKFNKIN